MRKASKAKKAVEWLNANPGRTQSEAAIMFDVSPSAVSVAMKENARLIGIYLSNKDAIDEYMETNTPHCLSDGRMTEGEFLRGLKGFNRYHAIPPHAPVIPQLSRTEQALDWYAANGGTQADTADKFGIHPSGFCAALRRERALGVSPEAQARRDAMRPLSDTERAARIALELCGPGLGDVVAAAIRANNQPLIK